MRAGGCVSDPHHRWRHVRQTAQVAAGAAVVALPIAVIKRFITWFHDFGIPVGGVVVNMLIDETIVGEDAPEFVVNRVAMQTSYMDEIWRSFSDVRAVVPLFETEIRGVGMLARTADVMFA